jgi:response regulator RpfG family c-di-GMP phosphodiesterase
MYDVILVLRTQHHLKRFLYLTNKTKIMNKIDQNPNYKELYQIVAAKYKKTNLFSHGPLDEVFFTMRVYETAKELIKKVKKPVKKEQVLVAAILHDIGKIKLDEKILNLKFKEPEKAMTEWKKHPKLSVPLAKSILKNRSFKGIY